MVCVFNSSQPKRSKLTLYIVIKSMEEEETRILMHLLTRLDVF